MNDKLIRIKNKMNKLDKMIQNLNQTMQYLLTQEFLKSQDVKTIIKRFNRHILKLKNQKEEYYNTHKNKFQ